MLRPSVPFSTHPAPAALPPEQQPHDETTASSGAYPTWQQLREQPVALQQEGFPDLPCGRHEPHLCAPAPHRAEAAPGTPHPQPGFAPASGTTQGPFQQEFGDFFVKTGKWLMTFGLEDDL